MNPTVETLYPVILRVPQLDRDLRGSKKVQALSRLARQALARSCSRSGLRLESFPKDDRGAPLPVDGIHWSVSHKSDVVGGVAAPLPVGFDLETVRPVNEALMTKIAEKDEWRLAGGHQPALFFRFWTAKEAVLKAVGKGIAGLTRCRVREVVDERCMILTFDEQRWSVEQVWFGRHLAALTSHQLNVVWTINP